MSKLTLDKPLIVWYIITMKAIMRLLGAKYMVTSPTGTRYFWRLNSAIKAVENNISRDIVWTLDYKAAYTHRPVFTGVHADANNFTPYQ